MFVEQNLEQFGFLLGTVYRRRLRRTKNKQALCEMFVGVGALDVRNLDCFEFKINCCKFNDRPHDGHVDRNWNQTKIQAQCEMCVGADALDVRNLVSFLNLKVLHDLAF